jgi:hypothetical protein
VTFRERFETSPVGWSAVCFIAGVGVTLAFVGVINSYRGQRDKPVAENTTEPSRAPTFPPAPAATKDTSIRSEKAGDSGNMEMTIQQFTRRYLDLDGRYAEQEAFLKRADRKRVRWKVMFAFPVSHGDSLTVYFDVPAESHNEKPMIGSPVRWADFPINFRDRVYSLKRGGPYRNNRCSETVRKYSRDPG